MKGSGVLTFSYSSIDASPCVRVYFMSIQVAKTSQCPSNSTPVGKALAVVISFFCEKARGVRQSGDATLEILGVIMNHD